MTRISPFAIVQRVFGKTGTITPDRPLPPLERQLLRSRQLWAQMQSHRIGAPTYGAALARQ